MPTADLSASAAVQIAWKIAAGTAKSSGGSIKPSDFLYGIFSLDKIAESDLPSESRAGTVAEIAELKQRCSLASVDFRDIRRKIRGEATKSSSSVDAKATSGGGPITRSEAVRQAFEDAATDADGGRQPQVRLLGLTRSLLAREPNAHELLGVDATSYAKLLEALSASPQGTESPEVTNVDFAAEDLSIFASLPAGLTGDSKADWARIGSHFSALCELSWQSGTSARIETLYESALKVLLNAIPAAQQGAIMTQDERGNLLLKAHYPLGSLPASSSSARKAMMQRESFIWQRGEDLSASQRESRVQAGVYAPILSTSETFGVICLDADAVATRFTRDDLFLVTSLGQQLGLTVANRKLGDSLRQSTVVLERLLTNFSPKVRDRLLLKAETGRLKLGGEKSVISILSSDIRGFTRMTAAMDTEDVVSLLNEYFSMMVAVIFRHGGSVDKFIGDAIMAVFGSPEADSKHAENSLRAALEMQTEIKNLSARRLAAGLQACEIGIGVHTGEVIHGFIGSPERMEFTVIGSAVNFASRLCDAAKGGEVILSGEMVEHVWREAVIESVEVATKHEGMFPAYRLLHMRAPK
jgi:adenylate cyclase